MYLACSSESSVRWASKFGRCKLATYSSGGKRKEETGLYIVWRDVCSSVHSGVVLRSCHKVATMSNTNKETALETSYSMLFVLH